ncbi:type II toxin-antitoxin system RelE/ParE family toxin [Providencia rettgeri]|uniref:type II toxin-antitoxin system RelE/ParE family toxin n=1 Tax=Providencia rettgeri TaxID=587 RepID=UPI003982D898
MLQKTETKPLRDVLFELRSIRNDLDRGLCVCHKGKIIYILLIFIKNTKNRI